MAESFNHLPEIIVRLEEAAAEAVHHALESVVESAKQRVPYDPSHPPHLRDAIHIEDAPEGTYVVAGGRPPGAREDVWYGHIVEHGSVKMAARPFLVPALEEHVEDIVRDVAEAVRQAVK